MNVFKPAILFKLLKFKPIQFFHQPESNPFSKQTHMRKYFQYIDRTVEMDSSLVTNPRLNKELNRAIAVVFSDFHDARPGQPTVFRFCFTTALSDCWDPASECLSMGDAFYYDGKYKIYNHGATIVLDTTAAIPTIYYLVKNSSKNTLLSRMSNATFASDLERQLNVFYYRVFLVFMQWWNIKNGFSFIHASAFAYNEQAYLLSATSGIGKSSFLIAASVCTDFSFISDDLTIVGANANAYYLGRKISIKPYHLDYFPWLKSKLNPQVGALQALQWQLLSSRKNVSTGISNTAIYQGRIENGIPIKKVIHLMNHHSNAFKIVDIKPDALSKIAVSIIQSELFLALEFFSKINYFPQSNEFLEYDKFANQMFTLFNTLFSTVEISCVLVPYRTDPNLLYEYLKQNLLDAEPS